LNIEVLGADAAFNYRMLDYYEREKYDGEHRDFGSFTLIFPSHAGVRSAVRRSVSSKILNLLCGLLCYSALFHNYY
jgi:hypothetical protein